MPIPSHLIRHQTLRMAAAPQILANHCAVTPGYLTHTPLPSLLVLPRRPPTPNFLSCTPWRNIHRAHGTESNELDEALPAQAGQLTFLRAIISFSATFHLFSYAINGMATHYPKPAGQAKVPD
ncbi:hypothetical protein CMUS01_01712 [Colletotrichum musicola]|uniref:Uncharacterized protein n=1 Tax=Colletotrichum musicola TaxID=2175873 RepID=A0A8H6U7S6_9PEZI|nr:hypothetical protein CMUS01_01712 [Colletotrichum musicola]